MKKIKWILLAFIVFLVLYTRLINISWGLPYPFHPDERNMAASLQQLNCSEFSILNFKFKILNCLNPRFFAYGQLPLYLGYFFIQIFHLLTGKIKLPITFIEAIVSLRLISSLSSIISFFVLMATIKLLKKKPLTLVEEIVAYLVIIFTPVFIQMAHFGTTESLLMLFYSLIVYECLLFISNKIKPNKFYFLTSLVCGLAVATKISSIIFTGIFFLTIISTTRVRSYTSRWIVKSFLKMFFILLVVLLISIIFSPHNLISYKEFISAFKYESDVALGNLSVFYTRQFVGSIPIIFQGFKVFPYALGWPMFILGLLGLLGLSWKDKNMNLLRLAFFIYFLPNVFIFAKWTRFMAPVFPLMMVFTVLTILYLPSIFYLRGCARFCAPARRQAGPPSRKKFDGFILIFIVLIIPGIAYLSVYQNPDVRITASNWIYKNIPSGSYLLSETANVVDLPLNQENYQYKSFDFYHLDGSEFLLEDLRYQIDRADYIFVPSRRIFMNHPRDLYPKLNEYYDQLFSGKLGYKKIAEFSSYPKIKIFGKKIVEFPDEMAEETWTVFDHPVIRIYKKYE